MGFEPTRVGRSIFLVLGVLILLSFFRVVNDATLTYASRAWLPTTACIIAIAKNVHKTLVNDKDGILYQYSVGGISYTNGRISYSRRSKWSANEWNQWAKPLAEKQNIEIYYDPANPQRSVIMRGGDNRWNIGFAMAQLFSVCLFVWLGLRSGTQDN